MKAPVIDAFLGDLRYAVRTLMANPGFTVVVVLSLAAGIGANSAIFSIANAVLLRSLPVPDADRLYAVRYESRLPISARFSYPLFEKLREGFAQPGGLAAMSRVSRMRAQVSSGAAIEPANVQLVSGEFFDVLNLQAQAGRLFTSADNRTIGAHPLAVVSDGYWRRRFNAGADVIGREIALNGVRFSIIGIAPPRFTGVWLETPVDAWIPAMMQADVKYTQNFSASNADFLKPWIPQDGLRWLEFICRADRVSGPERASLDAVFQPLLLQEAEHIADAEERKLALDRRLIIEPFAHGNSGLRAQFRAPLLALMGMVGLLLLVACANAANLLLSRAATRQREMAVRLSIGASRGRIIAQLLTESMLLGTLAAIVGLAAAPMLSELLVRLTTGVSGPLPFPVGIDGRVLVFTAAITLITSLLFGFAPAWRATDVSLSGALKASSRSTHHGARLNASKLLVVAQVALSLMLVVGAALFARSFGNLVSVPLGFEPRVVSAAINPSLGGYTEAQLPALYQRIVGRVETLPGVQSATVAMCGVMTGCRSMSDGLAISGYTAQPGEQVGLQENRVGPDYFETVGMRLVSGRAFDAQDDTAGRAIAIVNEAAVRRYFKGRDPIGQRFGYEKPDTEIVGVVADARVNTVREEAGPMAFFPLGQRPTYAGSLQVRTVGDPAAVAASLAKAIQEIEPALPVDRVMPVTELAAGTLRQDRLVAGLTMVLGMLALGLSCLGLYGVMSYAVKQRTPELGIRFALGAPRARVLWMVFRESLALMTAGLVIGLPLLYLLSGVIGQLLFGISGSDPWTIAVTMAVLLTVGGASSYVPAFRASRVDPMIALRQD